MNQVQIIGQQQKQAQSQILAAINQLSIGIYSQLAVAAINTIDVHQEVDSERLKALAKHSQVAAMAYFEGLEIIQRS